MKIRFSFIVYLRGSGVNTVRPQAAESRPNAATAADSAKMRSCGDPGQFLRLFASIAPVLIVIPS